MEILVSGEAGIVAVLGNRVQIRALGAPPRKVGTAGAALGLFADCKDVVRYDVRNVAEADAKLKEAYSLDRAFRLIAIACDSVTPQDEISQLRPLIIRLLEERSARVSFENRLYAAPLPTKAISRLRVLSESEDFLSSALRGALAHQTHIEAAANKWATLDPALFEDEQHRAFVWSSLVIGGSIKEWATSRGGEPDRKFLYLSLASRHRGISNIDEILRRLLDYRPARATARIASQTADDDWADQAEEYSSSRDAYENALAQQRAIAAKIRSKDFAAARAFVDDLVRQQLMSSGPERTAKSLCRLAQTAKQEAAPDFQLELAYRACELFPGDPQNHGHLADALIGFGRYADAENAIRELESLGDRLFAGTQRARILRLRGQWPQAREMYLNTAREFDNYAGVEHAWAGAAETLRDMGRVYEAINEYRTLVDRWPNEASLRTGLASALMEGGHLEEALVTFGRAASADKSPIPLNGRATALKMAGALAKAETAYREVLARFPSDPVTACGLADVLRLQGNLEQAFELYEQAQKLAPYSHIPILGIVDVLRDRGEFARALAVLQGQPEEISRHVQTKLSKAAILKYMGLFKQAALTYDAAIHENPHYVPAVVAKADLLRRVGEFDAAIKLYRRVIIGGVMVNFAQAGMAACLIATNELHAAAALLSNANTETQSDWQKYLIKGSLLQEQGASRAAVRHLERGIARCPFARLRKSMSNLLASIHLSRKEHKTALRFAVRVPGEASNVVYLHALAANRRTGQARQVLREDAWQPDALQFGHGIARLYDFDGSGPAPDQKFVFRRERALLLQAA